MRSENGNGVSVMDAPAAVAVKTVALVGTATTSRDLVFEQGEGVEIWGLNASYDWMPAWSRWFEMHDRDRYTHIQGSHLERLQSMECPIYMARRYDDIPGSVAFPVDFITQGGRFRPLLTSSVAYMLALALAEGFKEIRLMGIDMAQDSEYAYQRSACEYWLGVADALGVSVVIPDNSPIGKAPLYGLQSPEMDRSLVTWQDTMDNERRRVNDDFLTNLYRITYQARLEAVTGKLKGPLVVKFVEELQEFVDEGRIHLAAIEGAQQILVKMKKQDGG